MNAHKMIWERHFDILLHQEALLHDALSEHGYHATSAGYNIPEEDNIDDNKEKFQIIAADKVIAARHNQIAKNNQLKKKEILENLLVSNEKVSSELEESYCKSDATIAQLEAKCDHDEIVKKYSEDEELSKGAYPPTFERIVPRSILKALSYCTNEERERLISDYCIPRHVAVVLSYADEEFEESVLNWSFGRDLHPAVLKAFFYSK